MYSTEINYWLFRIAIDLAQTRSDLDVIYLHTTDYPMHMWPPEAPESQTHMTTLDEYLGAFHEAAPEFTIALTADHGMNAKTRMVDLEDALARGGIRATAVPIIKDRYVAHHNNLGGCMFVYLDDGEAADDAAGALRETRGVERVYTRRQAANELRLNYERIGDLVVTGDADTVFGPKSMMSSWDDTGAGVGLRSHASAHERDVPIIGHGGDFDGFAFEENRDIGRYVFERVLG